MEQSADTEKSSTALHTDDSAPSHGSFYGLSHGSAPSHGLGLKPFPLYPTKGFFSGEDEPGIKLFPCPLLESEVPRELVGLSSP